MLMLKAVYAILKLIVSRIWKKLFDFLAYIFKDTKRTLLFFVVLLSVVCVLLVLKNNEKSRDISTLTTKVETLEKKLINTVSEYEKVLKIERESYQNYKKTVEKLSRLEPVANKKQSLAEKLVNNGSKERNRCFELATGASAGILEKNSVCPHLLGKK